MSARTIHPRGDRWAVASLGVLLLAMAIWWLHLGRGQGLRGDDWDFAFYRVGWSKDALLAPHVDHLSLLGILYIRAVWSTLGLDAFWAFRLINVALFAALLSALFVFARPRIGAWGSVALVALLAFLGPAAEDLLWAFQGQFLLSLLFGVLCLLALRRRDLPGDVAATVLLGASLASASYGIMFTAAVLVELLLQRRWRRLIVVIVPGVPYLLWRMHYHPGGSDGSGPGDVLKFVMDSYTGSVGQLGALSYWWGRVLGVAALLGVVVAWRAGSADRDERARRVALLALPLLTWVLSGYARALTASPLSDRYLLPNVLFLLLAAAMFLPPWRPTPKQGAAVAVAVMAAVAANMAYGVTQSDGQRGVADQVRLQLGAVELARPVVEPDFPMGPTSAFGNFSARLFFDAERRYGPAAVATEPQIEARDAAARATADQVIIAADRVGLSSAPATADTRAGASLPAISATNASVSPNGGCLRVRPSAPTGASATLRLPPTGIVVRPSGSGMVTLRARRWADGFPPEPIASARGARSIVVGRDDARAPWFVQVGLDEPTTICARGA